MAEERVVTLRALKSWDGLRVHIPADVIRAAKLRPNDIVAVIVDPERPKEFVVRKV